ncbi:MAG: 4Fe-4S dicluster domain-containing protein [Candidatus Natronoplasma sp.]
MSLIDLTSMAEPDEELQEKIEETLEGLREDIPDFCYQCGKCTSGCEAFILLELEPHSIMGKSRAGFIDELVNSDEIWTCMQCFKCQERCPQDLSPVRMIFALKNLAVASGKEIPSGYQKMLQSVLGNGLIQQTKEVLNRANNTRKRDDYDLPPVPQPEDMDKVQQILIKATQEKLR